MESMDAVSGVTSSMSFSRENCLKEEVLVILAMTTQKDVNVDPQKTAAKLKVSDKAGQRGLILGIEV